MTLVLCVTHYKNLGALKISVRTTTAWSIFVVGSRLNPKDDIQYIELLNRSPLAYWLKTGHLWSSVRGQKIKTGRFTFGCFMKYKYSVFATTDGTKVFTIVGLAWP
jgi:hypothetical protein